MPVDPADYPQTSRGYRYPTALNDGGAEANAATDPPAQIKALAEAVDADIAGPVRDALIAVAVAAGLTTEAATALVDAALGVS